MFWSSFLACSFSLSILYSHFIHSDCCFWWQQLTSSSDGCNGSDESTVLYEYKVKIALHYVANLFVFICIYFILFCFIFIYFFFFCCNIKSSRRRISRLVGATHADNIRIFVPFFFRQGTYTQMMADFNHDIGSRGMSLLYALNWSFFLHLALSCQAEITFSHNAIHKVLYFVTVSGSFLLDGVPSVGIYAVCSTIGPWCAGDYVQIHSPLNVTPECW